MRITIHTKYNAQFVAVEKCLTEDGCKALMDAAERVFGNMYDLTLSEFFLLGRGDFSRLGSMRRPSVLQVYWMKRFAVFVDEFAKALKSFKPKQTAEEKAAADACPQSSYEEALLMFARSYFGLQSFEAASRVKLGEIMIAKKDVYIESVYRRILMNKQTKK